MRLVLLTQDFPPDTGGIETYSIELARAFAARCERFAVIAPARPESERIDRQLGFPVVRVDAGSDAFPARAILPLRRLIANRDGPEDRPAVFHAQWPTVLTSVGARWSGRGPSAVFCAAHGRELLLRPLGSGLLQRGYDGLRSALLRTADRCFPVSRYTADLLRTAGVKEDRITVVGNGTDPDRFRPLDVPSLSVSLTGRERPTLLTVGRLVRRKGIDTVFRAVDRLRDRFPDLLYVIAGDGPDRERLERLSAEMELEAHVRFAGRVPHEELPRYYGGCDVFVMVAESRPPDVEGFGIVFLEANACEIPVVGARAGGVPDAIVDGDTGRLVPPGDPDVLTEVLGELLTDPEHARTLGRRGRARVVREANWPRAAERLLAEMHAHFGRATA